MNLMHIDKITLFQFFCRGTYPPAVEYVNYLDRPNITLVEKFRNMQLEVEEPLENGELDHEVHVLYV